MQKFILIVILTILSFPGIAQQPDEFLTSVYDKLHDSPMQQKFKKIKPMPAGVVYIQHQGEGEKEIRDHFRLMKKLGFNSLKGINPIPGWTVEKISLMALEEGLTPWWYGEGGWEDITPGLLKKLGIPATSKMSDILKNPKMVQYQTDLMKQSLLRKATGSGGGGYEPSVGGFGVDLTENGKKLFIGWCQKTYGQIENLNKAWNADASFYPRDGVFTSWEDFTNRWDPLNGGDMGKECRNFFDILKFKVDHHIETLAERLEKSYTSNPNAPSRAGGELGLFRPQASFPTDLESIANLMTKYGSFYPSIHFVWHFNEVKGELARPFYMQASLATDYFKGGWAAPWESTGGPQQVSGEKEISTGFTVDDGVMTQFILSEIAAGFKGFGLWCWSIRTAGIEVGEYSLLDRNNQAGPRVIKVGQIARTMDKYRDEIWDARKEPLVGVLTDWNNEAMMAVFSMKSRPGFKQDPLNCRIGVSRALINANVPFEYVTVRDLKAGLAQRYKIIYMPGNMVFSRELMPILTEYVRKGGRLVMDMPGAMTDEYSVVYPTGKGSDFEKLFGTTINDFQFSGYNITNSISNFEIRGTTVYATPTSGRVMAKYDNDSPAVIENKVDKGTSVLIGYEASKMCFEPGNSRAEKMVLEFSLGAYTSPYQCDNAIVYRISSPLADHYFLINDGKAKTVAVKFVSKSYKTIIDAITGETVNPGAITLQSNNGRWIRCEK